MGLAEQTSTPPPGRIEVQSNIWNIPYARNPIFTGREDLLLRLEQALHADRVTALSQPQAINGLGGIGKTQIAVEYAYRHRQNYQHVLWTLADTRESLLTGYTEIASLLGLVQLDEQEQTQVEVVLQWFKTNINWLLILDNADEPAILREFIPPFFGGHILLTSRAQSLGGLAQCMQVEVMDDEMGALLLLQRAHLTTRHTRIEDAQSTDIALAKSIAQELGGLPLALDQAGAYIEEIPCSLSEYQSLYQSHRIELLRERGGLLHDYPEAVATTWSLSFQRVEERDEAAADLLRFCAYLAPDALPETIIQIGAQHLGPHLQGLAGDRIAFNKALKTLGAYSLTIREPNTKTLRMHRLVQAVLKDSMDEQDKNQWATRVIRAVNHAFPEPESKNWVQCQQFLAQVPACIQLAEDYDLLLPELARLCQHAGMYTFDRAFFEQADLFFRKALAIYKQLSAHEETYAINIAVNQRYLGELYRVLGRYTEAEDLIRSALEGYEQWRPQDQLDKVTILTSLGELYHNVRRYDEAEKLFQQAHTITEERSGPDHYSNSIPLHHLARLYCTQERYEEAEPLFLRVLEFQKQSSKNEIEMAITLNNLAILYRAQKKYQQAEKLLRQTLSIEERLLGSNDPHTATALQNLGIIYMGQENYRDAETYLLQALAVKEKALGFEHQGTIRTMTNLAYVYRKQKRFEQAKSLLKKALVYSEKLEQANTAVVLRNLASVYLDEQNYEEAERLYLQALEMSERDTSGTQTNRRMVLKYLIKLYEILGEDGKAAYYRQQIAEL
jgi:tetratricopeptide (TPR) repeat protein